MALDDLQAQGYTVTNTSLATSALITDALARGDADVATFNNQTMWTAIAKGAKARTFMQGTQSSPYLLVKQGINSCRDLDGRPVAIPSQTGLNPKLFDTYFKERCGGVKPQILVIGESAGRSAALMAGQVDGVLVQFEETLQIEQKAPGKFKRLVDFGKEYSRILVNGLQVSEQWAAQNPQLAKDLIRAMLTAHRRVNDNPQLLYDEGVKRLGLDPAIAKQVGDACLQGGMFDPNGGLTKENVQYTLDFLANTKAVPASLKVEDVADLSYLNAVLDEIGRR
jgi:ABC-type nitrate/sulfonate/bicarbonate transport system substrate-binding protein